MCRGSPLWVAGTRDQGWRKSTRFCFFALKLSTNHLVLRKPRPISRVRSPFFFLLLLLACSSAPASMAWRVSVVVDGHRNRCLDRSIAGQTISGKARPQRDQGDGTLWQRTTAHLDGPLPLLVTCVIRYLSRVQHHSTFGFQNCFPRGTTFFSSSCKAPRTIMAGGTFVARHASKPGKAATFGRRRSGNTLPPELLCGCQNSGPPAPAPLPASRWLSGRALLEIHWLAGGGHANSSPKSQPLLGP